MQVYTNENKSNEPRADALTGNALAGVWSMINSFGSSFKGLSEGDMAGASFIGGLATRLTTVLDVELTKKRSQLATSGYSISKESAEKITMLKD